MRFRKSIKLFPGVRFNFSKSGISTSLGVKGATINIKPGRATRATVGIPGTGLSHTQNIEDSGSAQRSGPSLTFVVIVILLVLFGIYGVMH